VALRDYRRTVRFNQINLKIANYAIRRHWRETHGPLAAKLPGPRSLLMPDGRR
jgi:hypothetical protein